MADNPSSPNSGSQPPLPSSGTTGRLKAPTTQLPIKKGGPGKIVVMLSSVAKPPPVATPAPDSPPKVIPVSQPPPLPPKQVSPNVVPPPPRLSTTTYVKLPQKTAIPASGSLSGIPIAPAAKESPAIKIVPPPLPKKSGAQHIPPIKLNEPSSEAASETESIFLQPDPPKVAPKPEGWKSLEPGELNRPAGSLQNLEVFARAQSPSDQPAPTPVPEAKVKTSTQVAPPLLPPHRKEPPAPAEGAGPSLRPPPLPLTQAKPDESSAAPPLHVAPPLLGKALEPPSEKLAQPNFTADVRKDEAPPESSVPEAAQKVPALVQPDMPLKALPPPIPRVIKIPDNWLKKKSTPIVVSSTSPKPPVPTIVEAKPALKTTVLPKRAIPLPPEPTNEGPPAVEIPKVAEAKEAAEKTDAPASAIPLSETVPPVKPPDTTEAKTAPSVEKEKAAETVAPEQTSPALPVLPTAKAPLPKTRAERAKKRRFVETVIFWAVLVPITVILLFLGSLYFGRDTRVEGQVIPPAGMPLNNEMWIVTDFSSLASGIAEDLAAERTPLEQEIQEKQDHVERAQADVAAREERIRLIQQDIQASKDEINSLIKQSRDATQAIWDGEGAEIDSEYQARFDQLKNDIASRAKSLKLNYQPDPNFDSPEVWANSYRLALYDVPAGVDGVKEHQWISDEMKQWRDFLKTLDDRKEQLREQAAQTKLAPAPKIADLNTKILDLQQRSDSTAAEEVPLKAELQAAQDELAQAQAADAVLDDKYYKQLDALPADSITLHIPLQTNGRFTWIDGSSFAEGEKEHHYWIFSRATRADGRQYWALHPFTISKNQTVELIIEPDGFISTKAILRPNLSPDEQEQ